MPYHTVGFALGLTLSSSCYGDSINRRKGSLRAMICKSSGRDGNGDPVHGCKYYGICYILLHWKFFLAVLVSDNKSVIDLIQDILFRSKKIVPRLTSRFFDVVVSM